MRNRLLSSRGLAIVAVSVFCLIGGVLLAWWQWTRYQSASGTLQNLGYVLQWPLFGVFPGFLFWRIFHLSERENAPVKQVVEQRAKPVAALWTPDQAYVQNRTMTYRGEEDSALLSYNKYLAQLGAREEQHAG